MTRINIIPPVELTDQHLVAEYREIFMVGSSLQRSLKSPNWDISKIPKKFTLNKGHVTFFYDKGAYLHSRYGQLIKEMHQRGMNPDPNRKFKLEQWPAHLYNDWIPSTTDQEIIHARINQRIAEKPGWYRYYGSPYLYGHFIDMGYEAFQKGIREPEDDPAYLMATLAEAEGVMFDPVDDWTQGWLKAAYEEKAKNDK
jgi:deoxyribonuclease (pyrimidine dimer)